MIRQLFIRLLTSLQGLSKSALVGRLAAYELALQWVWLALMVLSYDFLNSVINYYWLIVLFISCTVAIPTLLLLTRKVIQLERRQQDTVFTQVLIMLAYSAYLALTIMLIGADSFLTGVSFVSCVIVAMLLMNRRVAWYFFWLQSTIVIGFILAPIWIGELPSLKQPLINNQETDTLFWMTNGQTFWRTNSLFLGLPKVMALAFTVGKLLDAISQHRQLIKRQAEYDDLTNVRNRYSLFAYTRKLLNSKKLTSEMSIVLIDLDRFKLVNDRYGHSAGDKVLQKVAAFFKQKISLMDEVGRYGGEEFAILMPNTSQTEAVSIAQNIRQDLAKLSIKIDEDTEPLFMTASFGVATLDADSIELVYQSHQSLIHCRQLERQFSVKVDDLLKNVLGQADKALYQAKAAGRNKVMATSIQINNELNALKTFTEQCQRQKHNQNTNHNQNKKLKIISKSSSASELP